MAGMVRFYPLASVFGNISEKGASGMNKPIRVGLAEARWSHSRCKRRVSFGWLGVEYYRTDGDKSVLLRERPQRWQQSKHWADTGHGWEFLRDDRDWRDETNCESGCGTVFRISPSGTYTSLYSFGSSPPMG